jgi:hypothetical protein
MRSGVALLDVTTLISPGGFAISIIEGGGALATRRVPGMNNITARRLQSG